jgi:hypothetical protein
MSRRNSRFQKAIRREQRAADKERAIFIHSASQEYPSNHRSRKDRRGRN